MAASRGSFASNVRCGACQAEHLVTGETLPPNGAPDATGAPFAFRCERCWAKVRITLPSGADLARVSVHRRAD